MKAEIAMPKVMRGVTLETTLTGMKRTRVRIWLGCKVMNLAAMIMGCNIEVEMRT